MRQRAENELLLELSFFCCESKINYKLPFTINKMTWFALSLAVPHVLLKGRFKVEDIMSKVNINKDHF